MGAPHVPGDGDSLFEVDGGIGGIGEVGDGDGCVGEEENDDGALWTEEGRRRSSPVHRLFKPRVHLCVHLLPACRLSPQCCLCRRCWSSRR